MPRLWSLWPIVCTLLCACNSVEPVDVSSTPLRVEPSFGQILDQQSSLTLIGRATAMPPNSDAMPRWHIGVQRIDQPTVELGVVTHATIHPLKKDVIVYATPAGELIEQHIKTSKKTVLWRAKHFAGWSFSDDGQLAVMAGQAPDFQLVVIADGKATRWTQTVMPRWMPFWTKQGHVAYVSNELGKSTIVTMAGANHVPKALFAQPPTHLPSKSPSPFYHDNHLIIHHSGGVSALDARDGKLVWTKPKWARVLNDGSGQLRPVMYRTQRRLP